MVDKYTYLKCGKYYNRTYEWVMTHDLNYCKWVLNKCDCGPLMKFADWLRSDGSEFSDLLKLIIHPPL